MVVCGVVLELVSAANKKVTRGVLCVREFWVDKSAAIRHLSDVVVVVVVFIYFFLEKHRLLNAETFYPAWQH